MDRPVGLTVFLDACVLYSVVLCDALLTAASLENFQLKWSRRVEDEWLRAAMRGLRYDRSHLERRRNAMRRAYIDWEVTEADAARVSSDALQIPDPDDRHVVAAAIGGNAQLIITMNLRDFPQASLSPYGVRAVHPDEFLVERFNASPRAMTLAFERSRQRLKKPTRALGEYLDSLVHHGLPRFAACLRGRSTTG